MNILSKQINYNKQGDVGLGIAIGYFVSQGFTVSIPLSDSQNYDIIIDDGALKKVQVKTKYGWQREHIYIMKKYLDRTLKDDEIVHHCDENKKNNTIENLELMLHSEHTRFHNKKRHLRKG